MLKAHDPFPMSSPQAQRLALSVEGSESSNWYNMATQSAGRGPAEHAREMKEASEYLVGDGKKNQPAIIPEEEDHDEDHEDDFLDRPTWELRGTTSERRMVWAKRLLERIYKRLYGDKLPPSEMLRTLCLSSTLFFMIGALWLLRSLKDPVLTAICGVSVIPKAKMVSVFVVLGVVSIYNHLLDSNIPKHRLFYVFGTFYFFAFLTISYLLAHPTIGLKNEQHSPYRLLGWVSYCTVESFGSVMVSLFWSFANSNFNLETAKASYGVMVAAAQIGSITGPTIVNRYAHIIGVANCYVVGAIAMLFLQLTMRLYVKTYGVVERNTSAPQSIKTRAGILEGLHLFAKYSYIKGIFVISCVFMIEGTIVDFTLKLLAKEYFAEEYPCEVGMSCYNPDTGEHGMSQGATAAFTTFMGFFGQATNTLSFLFSLLGTSAVIRYLGLRWTLLLFPSLLLCVIIFVRLNPTLPVAFGAMMLIKGFSYSLNNPTKEMLYQPTSAAVRYKAKSWIDIFGARGAKALGSVVTNAFSNNAESLVANGSLVGMGVASFLIWNATFMGKKFDEYVKSGYIVGEDAFSGLQSWDANKYSEMAFAQNQENTSCAIYEEAAAGSEEGSDRDSKYYDAVSAEVQTV